MTTADRRLLPGSPNRKGYRILQPAPGETHVNSLGGPADGSPTEKRCLLVFAQLSDTHVMDNQSPARVELLDRYGDPDLLPGGEVRTVGTYRPQEIFTQHVVEAMVQSVNRCTVGPVSGAPVDFAIVTGDLTDSAQLNELQSFLDLLDGRWTTPDSGNPQRYEGVASSDDPRYWHPEGGVEDLPRARYGFPTRPGVLAAARRPFKATGLRLPWYSVHGNHDNMLQGTVCTTPVLNSVATGSLKLVSPPDSLDARSVLERLEAADVAALDELVGSRAVTVTPDPQRRIVSRAEHLAAHAESGGYPKGHGYGPDNHAARTCYYAFDVGERVRAIVLDTVNPHGGWQGSLDRAQLSWLLDQLASASARLVVLFSHHPLECLVNDRAPAGHRRVLADEVRDLLLAHRCVVLWVNGHTHRHRVTPVCRAGSVGFWQVTTASHIDWPQQSRIVELMESPDGTVTIACTILDTAAPAHPPKSGDDPLTLAALARELSANCWQARAEIVAGRAGAGRREDRNVIVEVPARSTRSAAARVPAPALLTSRRVADELLELIDGMEELPYAGEPVSQRAHALQCATLAVGAGAPDELVAAALLHDIGHTPWVRAAAPRRSHERAAAAFLLPRVGDGVARLVAHHVAAKRYLVAVDGGYLRTLSAASVHSLAAQDGPASAAEVVAWRAHAWWPDVVLLRGWDDRAKVPGAPVLSPSRFRNLLARLAAR